MGLAVSGLNLSIDRGDDQTVRCTVKDSSGAIMDVSAGTFKFTVKATLEDDITIAVFQKTSPAASGIDLTQAVSGIVDVNVAAADTQALAGDYAYDLEMVLAGKTRTLAKGLFRVLKDVTTPGIAGTPQAPSAGYFASDAQYIRDTVSGLYWKHTMVNGVPTYAGPQASFPF